MHHSTRSTRRPVRIRSSSPLAVSALCSLACVAGAGAQDLLAPPPSSFSANPQNQPPGWPRGLGQAPPNLVPEAPAPLEPLFQYGPVQVRPHTLYRFSYGDGLPASPGRSYETVINEVDPGVLFDIGTHWLLDYTPTLRYYSNHTFRDTLDHSASLNGSFIHRDSTITFSQRYSTSSMPLIETGGQNGTETYATSLNVNHQLTAKTSLEVAVDQNFRYIDTSFTNALNLLQDSKQWTTLDWVNYQFEPRFGAAFGVGGGFIAFSSSPDMTFQQVMGRINWRPTDKLTLALSGGMDERQFRANNTSDLLSPIFSAAVFFNATKSTTLSLMADRSVLPSLLTGLVIESTGLTASLEQRLFKKLTLNVDGGYRSLSYDLTSANLSTSRSDDVTFVSASLNLAWLKQRGTAGIFVRHTDNTSSLQGYTLTSSQVGFDLGYRF